VRSEGFLLRVLYGILVFAFVFAVVSFAFFLGCLWPMRVLFRALRLGGVMRR